VSNMRSAWCVSLAVWFGAQAAGAREITMASLLTEMTDLKGMAVFPDPAYTCKQFSSYDRASKAPDDPKTWFANADAGQYLRVEDRDGRKEYVMMDIDGPGAVVRIWSANPEGVLRIYLDGNETPVLEAPMKDVLGGKLDGLPEPIACERSRGWNSYLPIPYAKHCKITSDNGRFYYHVNYRTYAPGTEVVSFERQDLKRLAPQITKIAGQLASPRPGGVQPKERDKREYDLTIEPGKSRTVIELEGPRAICSFKAALTAEDKDKDKDKDLVQALRHVVLTMKFDGEQTVESPIGDFFGAAPGLNPYDSLVSGVSKDGEMWSHWYMPFEKSATIELRNMGDEPVTVKGGLSIVPHEWTDRSMHFHARWRIEFDVPTRPMQDWNYLKAKADGKGVFAGVAFAIANPVKEWWGEGDEKIYVDGETFPSHFGTGTEDYYGYAWCCNVPFMHAYHNQPRCDGPGNYGHTSVNRWHIMDRIPFAKDFKFDMELWHWNELCKVTMSVMPYWYGMPGAKDTIAPIRPADLKLTILPTWTAPKVKGALEGEALHIIAKTAEVGAQDIDGCSDGKHLWWRNGTKPGDRLVLGFRVRTAGKYHVYARFVRAGDYGIVQMSVNGEKAGEPIDLYHDGVSVSKEADLGTFDMKKGENQLAVEIVGANEKAKKEYMFGLDYILLKPAE
jgi:hypothetical protein